MHSKQEKYLVILPKQSFLFHCCAIGLCDSVAVISSSKSNFSSLLTDNLLV